MGDIASGFFAGTGLVDFVLAVTLVEAALLVLWKVRTGRGMPVGDVLAMLLPGMWLMLALRSVVVQQHWLFTVGFLFAAGLGHIGDMMHRLRDRA